jgi:hypothetical protein
MGMSPDARRRLAESFQRRVDDRRGRLADRRQDAVRLGEHYDLGPATGLYRLEVQPPTGVRTAALMLAPVPVTVLVFLAASQTMPDLLIPMLGLMPVAVPGWIAVCLLTIRPRRFHRWLYAYADGFTTLDPAAGPHVVRWQDISDVVDTWASSGSDSTLWDFTGYRLTTATGEVVSITHRYVNMLDPYEPVGRLVAAMVPAEVGTVFPRFPTISELMAGEAIARVVARQAAALRHGAVVERGGVRVTRDGISGPKKLGDLPWAAIERVALRPGRVQIFPVGAKKRSYSNYADGSGYQVLCLLLRELGVTATYEATG